MALSQMQALAAVKKKLESKYKDSTELFPDLLHIRQIPVIPSGSTIIDALSGVMGYPKGRVIEIYGPYSSGKTTIGLEFIKAAQAIDPNSCGLFLDYEHALDLRYARQLGVDLSPDRFIFAQPEYGEQGGQIALELLNQDLLDWIIIDSAAAMTPRYEIEGELDEDGGTQKGTHASMMARILSRLTKMVNRGRHPVLLIMNQTRAKIEIGRNNPIANPGAREQSAAGNALKFYTSMRLELEIIKTEGAEKRSDKATEQMFTQNRVRATFIKNKVAPPFARGEIIIEYGKGINNLASICALAESSLGIMGHGGRFTYSGDKPETTVSGRGRDMLQDMVKNNPDLQKELESKVIKHLRAEHESLLGLGEIKVEGQAKHIEYETPDTIVLGEDLDDQTSNVTSLHPKPKNGEDLPQEDL